MRHIEQTTNGNTDEALSMAANVHKPNQTEDDVKPVESNYIKLSFFFDWISVKILPEKIGRKCRKTSSLDWPVRVNEQIE